MRVTDRYLQQTFLTNLNSSRKTLSELQSKIATQKEVQKPSDSPLGAARITRLQGQLNDISTFTKSIDTATDYLGGTLTAMEGVSDTVKNALTDLTTANNSTNKEILSSYAQKMGDAIKQILDYANTSQDGKYLFGGTATDTQPFASDATWYGVTNTQGGDQKFRVGFSADQKVNVSAEELFYPVVSQTGSFQKIATAGTAVTNSVALADATGKAVTLNITYTKTADQTYQMSYDVLNSSGTSVGSGSKQLVFDDVTGALKSVDGGDPKKVAIDIPGAKVNFLIDPTTLTEGSNAGSVSGKASQKANILNVMIDAKNTLASGQKPTDAQVKLIQDFYNFALAKTGEAGGYQDRLNSMTDMLQSQELEIKQLLSKEQEVDVAKAAIEMQSAQYATEMMYKTSSMLLPKSLLDYL